jgi:hypothetical protein
MNVDLTTSMRARERSEEQDWEDKDWERSEFTVCFFHMNG